MLKKNLLVVLMLGFIIHAAMGVENGEGSLVADQGLEEQSADQGVKKEAEKLTETQTILFKLMQPGMRHMLWPRNQNNGLKLLGYMALVYGIFVAGFSLRDTLTSSGQ